MNKQLQLLTLFLSLGICATILAQTQQSNFINYQGVASNTAGEVMVNETLMVGIALKYGISASAEYAENHSVTTNPNGVFSLQIGNGSATTGAYENYQWGAGTATFVTVSINGAEIGTTELLAVPYAINSGDWYKVEGDIVNANTGTVKVNNNLEVFGNVKLQLGSTANEISIDGTLAGNDDKAIPTEKAVKTYVDVNAASGLEKITEGASTGWRLVGQNPANYSPIGDNAVDFSYSTAGDVGGASGLISVAMGSNTIASGDFSTAQGSSTLASGFISTAMGRSTTASGDYSTAMGSSSTASGRNSTSMGFNTTASGTFSTAMNRNTTASGDNSTSMGDDTLASGINSTAMGDNTRASGENSTAMGFDTSAMAKSSTAMGNSTRASGNGSTAIGVNVNAKSFAETVFGQNNINYTPSATNGAGDEFWNPTDQLFVIGNGTTTVNGGTTNFTYNNALTILKNGKVGIGEHRPASLFEVAHQDGAPSSTDRTNAFSIKNLGSGRSWQLYTEDNGYLLLFKDGDFRGAFNADSGAYGSVSDRRVKKDIISLSDGTLQKLIQLNPVSYLMKSQKGDHRNLGLISQEVQKIFPSITHYVKDKNLIQISYTELIPILIKAIQEQQEIIEGQNTKMNKLLAEVNQIKKILKKSSLTNSIASKD